MAFIKLPPKSSYVDYDLSSLSIGLSKKIDEVEKSQHFTKPPSRYSEASLVKELEKGALGQPLIKKLLQIFKIELC